MRTESLKHLRHKRTLDGSGVLLDSAVATSPLDLREIFGNAHPVEVEIGCGKGAFMLARAQARPEINLLGVEYAGSYALYCADRLRRAGVTNTRMIATDAGELFRRALGTAVLWRVHVYFPDPWPKRKHTRRRLIQPGFVAEATRVLQPGGQLIVVTDHREYFEQIQSVLGAARGLAPIDMPRMSDADGEIVGTNFERKYISQGRAFYAIARMRYR